MAEHWEAVANEYKEQLEVLQELNDALELENQELNLTAQGGASGAEVSLLTKQLYKVRYELEQQREKEQLEVRQTSRAVADLQTKCETQAETTKELKNTVRRQQIVMDQLEQTQRRLQAQLDDASEQLEEAVEEVVFSKMEMEDTRMEFEEEVGRLKVQLEELGAAPGVAGSTAGPGPVKVQEGISELVHRCKQLAQQVVSMTQDKNFLQDRITTLTEAHEETKAELQTKLDDDNHQQASLKLQLAAAATQLEEKEIKINRLRLQHELREQQLVQRVKASAENRGHDQEAAWKKKEAGYQKELRRLKFSKAVRTVAANVQDKEEHYDDLKAQIAELKAQLELRPTTAEWEAQKHQMQDLLAELALAKSSLTEADSLLLKHQTVRDEQVKANKYLGSLLTASKFRTKTLANRVKALKAQLKGMTIISEAQDQPTPKIAKDGGLCSEAGCDRPKARIRNPTPGQATEKKHPFCHRHMASHHPAAGRASNKKAGFLKNATLTRQMAQQLTHAHNASSVGMGRQRGIEHTHGHHVRGSTSGRYGEGLGKPEFVHEGFLLRGARGNWKQLYFQLAPESLVYSNTGGKEGPIIMGTVGIPKAMVEDLPAQPGEDGHKHRFGITPQFSYKTHVLVAPSAAEKEAWILALSKLNTLRDPSSTREGYLQVQSEKGWTTHYVALSSNAFKFYSEFHEAHPVSGIDLSGGATVAPHGTVGLLITSLRFCRSQLVRCASAKERDEWEGELRSILAPQSKDGDELKADEELEEIMPFPVYVNFAATGKLVTVQVNPTSTVQKLKESIWEHANELGKAPTAVPHEECYVCNRVFDDEHRLVFCGNCGQSVCSLHSTHSMRIKLTSVDLTPPSSPAATLTQAGSQKLLERGSLKPKSGQSLVCDVCYVSGGASVACTMQRFGSEAISTLHLGRQVAVLLDQGSQENDGLWLGWIRFVGHTKFRNGVWVGVELSDPVGDTGGIVDGELLFDCPNKHGVVVRSSALQLLDQRPIHELLLEPDCLNLEFHGYPLENDAVVGRLPHFGMHSVVHAMLQMPRTADADPHADARLWLQNSFQRAMEALSPAPTRDLIASPSTPKKGKAKGRKTADVGPQVLTRILWVMCLHAAEPEWKQCAVTLKAADNVSDGHRITIRKRVLAVPKLRARRASAIQRVKEPKKANDPTGELFPPTSPSLGRRVSRAMGKFLGLPAVLVPEEPQDFVLEDKSVGFGLQGAQVFMYKEGYQGRQNVFSVQESVMDFFEAIMGKMEDHRPKWLFSTESPSERHLWITALQMLTDSTCIPRRHCLSSMEGVLSVAMRNAETDEWQSVGSRFCMLSDSTLSLFVDHKAEVMEQSIDLKKMKSVGMPHTEAEGGGSSIALQLKSSFLYLISPRPEVTHRWQARFQKCLKKEKKERKERKEKEEKGGEEEKEKKKKKKTKDAKRKEKVSEERGEDKGKTDAAPE